MSEEKNLPITSEEAIELLKSFPQKSSDMNHYLESEAIMKGVAEKFGEDVGYWGMLGLLHDVDWALTREDWKEHGVKAEEILAENGFDTHFIQIVQSHVYGLDEVPKFKDKQRTKKIEFALIASETLTGIISAYALMKEGNVSNMELRGLRKKFKDKKFAANCKRENILEIEKTGLSLDQFFELAIDAFKKIKGDIGLN